ncbi:PEP-CTERM sorting domain-containing protein [Roseibacillus persicicus]|uniref:PEP-CTERM sorting domain-containing protein n=1 Tax=Roseibacillus persicicus TaxID=454148 RepID=UPI00280DDD24|nr:PEP-CTERM sorting domain-containing protein [Roseibacillus persicicus]MDQ8190308.1 PEP-CTERM sorting domain-containing protein [Roseibacillus persicicus]
MISLPPLVFPLLLRYSYLSVFLSLAPALQAAVVFMEDYESLTAGELNGQSGTLGISGNWQSNEAITEVVSAPANLEVTLPTGEVISGGNQALQLTGNSNTAISASLSSPQSGTFFVSFLIQLQAGSIQTNDFATLWFGEGTHIGAPAIGIKAELGVANTDLMGRISGNQEAYAPEQLAVGESYYLVAKVSKTGSSNTYNQVEFWVNPGSGDESTPEAVSTGSISFSEFQDIGIRSANLDLDDVVLIDNLSVATDWNDLFVPEPSSSMLLGLSLLGLFTYRRRLQ